MVILVGGEHFFCLVFFECLGMVVWYLSFILEVSYILFLLIVSSWHANHTSLDLLSTCLLDVLLCFSVHTPSFPTVLQISARTVVNLVFICVRLTKEILSLLSPLFFSKSLWAHSFKRLFSAIFGSQVEAVAWVQSAILTMKLTLNFFI